MTNRSDVIVVGAGVAGLTAGCELSKRGFAVALVEARDRIGGRVYTEREEEFVKAYFHDWQNDPFSRGAYSYGKIGSDGAQLALAEPINETLFFAGEATDITGNNGTVHGAIASGLRSAKEITVSMS